MARPGTWICTASKGRLAHLEQTFSRLSALLQEEHLQDYGLALVDVDCPEGSGTWFEQVVSPRLTGRCELLRLADQGSFCKADALNRLVAVLPPPTQRLIFLDADTLVTESFFTHLEKLWGRDRFVLAGLRAGYHVRDLTGFLAVHADHFRQIQGFDATFRNYGAEDLDLRIRLHLEAGLDFAELDPDVLQPIEHDDALRVRFHEEKNLFRSNLRNQAALARKIERFTGRRFDEQSPTVLRLWGMFEDVDRLEMNEPDVVLELSTDEALLIHFTSGRYFHANAAGAAVLQALLAGTPLATLLRSVAESASEHVDEVRRFVGALVQENLLRRATLAPPSSRASETVPILTEAPRLDTHTDLEDLLLLDPIHEAADEGWPARA